MAHSHPDQCERPSLCIFCRFILSISLQPHPTCQWLWLTGSVTWFHSYGAVYFLCLSWDLVFTSQTCRKYDFFSLCNFCHSYSPAFLLQNSEGCHPLVLSWSTAGPRSQGEGTAQLLVPGESQVHLRPALCEGRSGAFSRGTSAQGPVNLKTKSARTCGWAVG